MTAKKLLATPMIYRKNLLINGNAMIAQRGSVSFNTSFVYGGVDRWLTFFNSSSGSPTGTATYSSGYGNLSSGRAIALDATCSSTNILFIGQRIESINSNAIRYALATGKKLSLQFTVWHNVGSTVTPVVYLQTANSTDVFSSTTLRYSNTSPGDIPDSTWTTIKVEGFSPTNTDFEKGCVLYIGFNTPVISSKTFYIGDIQLEIGDKCTSYDLRSVGEELELCQRYYQSYGGTTAYEYFADADVLITTAFHAGFYFASTFRTQPTFSYSSLSHFQITDGVGGSWSVSALGAPAAGMGQSECYLDVSTGSSVFVVGRNYFLRGLSTSARLMFDAEL